MAGDVSERRKRAQKHSKNDLANEIIELLREAAVRLVKLGDELESTKQDLATVRQQHAVLEEQWALVQTHEEQFEDWQELLLNFKSGIADKDEVLAGTVGR
jgi:flagellar motility protein MotE (MotC chaperone)